MKKKLTVITLGCITLLSSGVYSQNYTCNNYSSGDYYDVAYKQPPTGEGSALAMPQSEPEPEVTKKVQEYLSRTGKFANTQSQKAGVDRNLQSTNR